MDTTFVRGDSIELECTLGEDITGWKLRAELYSPTLSIKKATANTGGSDSQILITNAALGEFSIYIVKGDTTDINIIDATLEIEAETGDTPSKIYTVYQDSNVHFNGEKINWDTP